MLQGRARSLVYGAKKFLRREFSSNGIFSSDRKLAGQVAIITGGASGIGEETARVFAKQGARVVIADIQPADRVQSLLHELGSSAEYCQCDVRKEEEVAQVWEKAYALDNRLDIVFNNAGDIGAFGPIDDLKVEDFDDILNLNLRAVFLGIKHGARLMKPNKKGSIISTASIAGVTAGLGPLLYTVTKTGVVTLTKSAASELGKDGIRVNCVSPSAVSTPLMAKAFRQANKNPDMSLEEVDEIFKQFGPFPSRYMIAEDVANAVLYLASDVAGFVSGHNLVVDAGLTSYKFPEGGSPWF